MICPEIQLGNRKDGLEVSATSTSPDTNVRVAFGAHQKAGVRTDFAGGLYDLATAISSLQTAEYAFAVLAIDPMATKSALIEASPLGSTVSSLTVLSYDESTGVIGITPNLAEGQSLVGKYVKDVYGTTYEITEHNFAGSPASPVSPSNDTITITGGPTTPQASGDPFLAGQTITVVGQGLNVKVGGHKENVHYLTVAPISPGGYFPDVEIDLTTANTKRSVIAVSESLTDDELGIDLTSTLYVHWKGGVWRVTNVTYGGTDYIEIENGPLAMPDGEKFWLAPYRTLPVYDGNPTAPAKIPCVSDNWIPLAAILIYDGMTDVTSSDIYDLREDFHLLSLEALLDLSATDVTISGDQTNIVLAQMYVSTSAPTLTNDSADSAGLGVKFQVGALWFRTGVTPELYILADSTPLAADWNQIL